METTLSRLRSCRTVLTGIGWLFLLAASTQAQYTADFQTNTIDGVASNWMGNATYVVGSNNVFDTLQVINGGALLNSGWWNSPAAYIGYEPGASHNCVLVSGSGSVWSNYNAMNGFYKDLSIGYSGGGNQLIIANGGAVYSGSGYIGSNTSANGNSVLVTGSRSLWCNGSGPTVVGQYGAGNELIITNGGIAYESGSRGSLVGYGLSSSNNAVLVTGSGSVWSNVSSVFIGYGSAGNTLTIENGGKVCSTTRNFVGFQYGSSNNTVLVTGAGSVWSGPTTLYFGYYGAGNQLIITNGGALTDGLGVVGDYTSSNNTVLVTGSGSIWSNASYLVFGHRREGNSLTIASAGAVYSSQGIVGDFGSSNNTVVVTGTGSVWISSLDFLIGDSGGGPGSSGNHVTVSNSGRVCNGNGFVGYAGSNNTVLVTGTGSVWSNETSLYVGYSGSIGNSLGINNGGAVVASNMVVAANNSVTLNGGSLIVADGLVVSNNAVVKGSGLIQADLTLAGTLAPGNSPGSITNFGNLTLQATAALQFELGGKVQGSEYDSLFVTNGVASLDGLLQVSFINGFETNVLNSDTFTLLTATNVLSGSFTNVVNGQRLTTAGGEGSFLVDYSGNNLVLSDYQVIPEPEAWVLCGLGLAGLFVGRRRRVVPSDCSGNRCDRFAEKL